MIIITKGLPGPADDVSVADRFRRGTSRARAACRPTVGRCQGVDDKTAAEKGVSGPRALATRRSFFAFSERSWDSLLLTSNLGG